MNEKFFDIKTDKQERILNAAIKVFALNGYKKASTDVIVQEAGISKGLLFHYFTNKITLYEYIIDYSHKLVSFEMTNTVNKNEHDFFNLVMAMEQVKIKVTKNYPYMIRFLNGLKYEHEKEAVAVIGANVDVLDRIYRNIYRQSDNTKFLDYIAINRVEDMIRWMSDGFLRENAGKANASVEDLYEEFSKYIKMIKAHFYRGGMVGVDEEEIK